MQLFYYFLKPIYLGNIIADWLYKSVFHSLSKQSLWIIMISASLKRRNDWLVAWVNASKFTKHIAVLFYISESFIWTVLDQKGGEME